MQYLLAIWSFAFGVALETLSNSRVVTPCLSETAILAQSFYLISHFVMQFTETANAKYFIATLIFATHTFDVFRTDLCFSDQDGIQRYTLEEVRNFTLQEWNETLSGFFHIEQISKFTEIVIDVEMIATLSSAGNIFELGYFIGKMITNIAFVTLEVIISFRYMVWSVQNELTTTDETE